MYILRIISDSSQRKSNKQSQSLLLCKSNECDKHQSSWCSVSLLVNNRPSLFFGFNISTKLNKQKPYGRHLLRLVKLTCSFRSWISNYIYMKLYDTVNKTIERHTAHTIVSWPNPKQWVIVHTSDLMMIIRQSIYILSIITRGMGKLKTHSPTYCIMDNGENILNFTHTLAKHIWQAFYKFNAFR